MNSMTAAGFIIPTLLLGYAAVLDVKYGKFPNWLFLASLVFGALWVGCEFGGSELMERLGTSVLVFAVLIPLVFIKALGAGDIKLLAAFCLMTNLFTTGSVFIYSLFWGLAFGLVKMGMKGDLKTFAQSFVLRTPQVHSHKIPYVVAILAGWLSFLVWGGVT